MLARFGGVVGWRRQSAAMAPDRPLVLGALYKNAEEWPGGDGETRIVPAVFWEKRVDDESAFAPSFYKRLTPCHCKATAGLLTPRG